ncbi:MAG: amino acid adenylation domain-containing protein [Acidimicrobiales bacterium]|nr:amino acid adenylation domain-containing protein [Acidimicrobiales bacterium]
MTTRRPATGVGPDAPRCLGELLELDAGPGALAVADPDRHLDREGLRRRAGQVAAVLVEHGVRPGDRVGIHLESSVETMVAVHGVLRAGGVVVPLDPRGPIVQVGAQLRDCDVRVLIGGGSARRLAAVVDASPVTVALGPDEGPPGAAAVPWSDLWGASPVPPRVSRPDEPAYVIYTSGSTGRPKGIVHTHASAMAYARLSAETYGLVRTDVVATLSPLHFDQSTFSLYAAPLVGAAALFVPDALLRFPASLTQVVADRGTTVWYSVPTLLVHALRRGALDQRDLSALRWILYGGEAFAPNLLAELMARLPGARVSNVYGPAEVNQCTYHHLDGPPSGDEPVPIGRAWPETQIELVAPDGQPVPSGEVGELLVHTVTAMAGYWNQPEVTRAAFRRRPGADGRVVPWYATGDLAVERADGELVFVGRVDNQRKVRGHRVELESVDAELVRLAGVEQAIAVVVGGAEEDARIVGLVIASAAFDPTAARRTLAGVLPGYAVPSELIRVADLPTTATGKVDRRGAALLVPDTDAPTLPLR